MPSREVDATFAENLRQVRRTSKGSVIVPPSSSKTIGGGAFVELHVARSTLTRFQNNFEFPCLASTSRKRLSSANSRLRELASLIALLAARKCVRAIVLSSEVAPSSCMARFRTYSHAWRCWISSLVAPSRPGVGFGWRVLVPKCIWATSSRAF